VFCSIAAMSGLPPMTVLAASAAKPASSVRRCKNPDSWLIIEWLATAIDFLCIVYVAVDTNYKDADFRWA